MHPVNLLLPQPTLTHRASQATAQFYLHSLQSKTGLNDRCRGRGLRVMEAVEVDDTGVGGRKGEATVRMDRPLFQYPPGSQASGAESR